MTTWLMKNTAINSSNKGFYDPRQPENHRKEREKGKEARAEEKRLATVLF